MSRGRYENAPSNMLWFTVRILGKASFGYLKCCEHHFFQEMLSSTSNNADEIQELEDALRYFHTLYHYTFLNPE